MTLGGVLWLSPLLPHHMFRIFQLIAVLQAFWRQFAMREYRYPSSNPAPRKSADGVAAARGPRTPRPRSLSENGRRLVERPRDRHAGAFDP